MNKIKQYWDERAKEKGASVQATTDDVFLRSLEIAKLTEKLSGLALPPGAKVLDLGCGDGHSTLQIAASFPAVRFLGIDYSENMIATAQGRLNARSEFLDRVSFRIGDVQQLSSSVQHDCFDVILTVRCLINIASITEQFDALRQIADRLKPGGYYFGIENFVRGQNNMNRLRAAMNLPEIPIRWHNCFFDEGHFQAGAEEFFDDINLVNFSSSYYLVTRVIYSAMCQLFGKKLDYHHPFHKIAVMLPSIGDFSPIKLVSMRRKK